MLRGRYLLFVVVLAAQFAVVACSGPSRSAQPSDAAAAWEADANAVHLVALDAADALGADVPDLPEAEPLPDEPWPELVTGVALDSDEIRERVAELRDTEAALAVAAAGLDEAALVAALLARNPAVAAARARVRAVAAEHGQLDAVARTLAQYEAFARQLDPQVAQRLPRWAGPEAYPLPGEQGLRSRVIALAVQIAATEFERTLRDRLARARTAFAEVVFRSREQAVLTELRELVRSVAEVAQARFRAGRVDFGAVAALEARGATLANDVAQSERAKERALAELRDELDLPAEAEFGELQVPALPSFTESQLAAWHEQALDAPRIRAMQTQTERLEAMIEMLDVMSRPRPALGLSDLPEPLAERPAFREMPRMLMDAPWFGRQEAYRAELAHRAHALRSATLAAHNRILADAQAAQLAHAQAQADAALSRDTLAPLAQQEIDATLAAFRAGTVNIEQVLGAVERRLQATLGEARASRNEASALAELDRLLGAAPAH